MTPVATTHDDEDDDYVAARERRARRRWLLALGLLVALGAALFFGLRPAARALKSWQARRLGQEAAALLAQAQPAEAVRLALDAARLSWDEPLPRRVAAAALGRLGRTAEALRVWRELERDRHPLTPRERVDYATAAFLVGDSALAAQQLATFGPEQPDEPAAVTLLRALAARSAQNAPEAVRLARTALSASAPQPSAPNSQPSALNSQPSASTLSDRERFLAATLVADLSPPSSALGSPSAISHQPSALHDALAALRDLALQPGPIGLEALVWHVRHPRAVYDGARLTNEELLAGLCRHEPLRAEHELVALEVELRLRPEATEQILARVEAQFTHTRLRSELALFAAWLNDRGRFGRVLALVDPREARQQPELFGARLQAMAGMERWEEIAHELRGIRESELEASRREMFLARIQQHRGQLAAAETHWRQARAAAAGDPARLLALARSAEQARAFAAAEAAYRQAADTDPVARVLQDTLLRFLLRQADTAKVQQQLTTLRRRWPSDPDLVAQELYLAALRRELPPDALATAERLCRDAPARPERRANLALILLRQGLAARALAVLPTGEQVGESAVVRLIRAAASQAAGFEPEARAALAQLARSDLRFPEERELFDAILRAK